MKDKFGYEIHYMRVWEVRRKAIENVFSDWNGSYNVLSKWLNILKDCLKDIKISFFSWECTFYACLLGF